MSIGTEHGVETTVIQQVAERIRELITRNGLKRGAAIPSYRELAREYGAAYVSVKQGVDLLAAEGILRKQRGKGCFVSRELAMPARKLAHLGVVITSSRNSLFQLAYLSDIMRGLTDEQLTGADLHIFSMRQDGMVSPAQIGEWDISGTALVGVENDDYLRAFAKSRMPAVVVDYCSEAVPLDYVACDNRAAVKQMVSHLARLGHRRIAYLTPPLNEGVVRPDDPKRTLIMKNSSDRRERQMESTRMFAELGLLADVYSAGEAQNNIPQVADGLLVRKGQSDCPTAVLSENNMSARKLVEALAQRGIRVPEDISVAAVASDSLMSVDQLALTCCQFDFAKMGRTAVTILTERCRNPGVFKPHIHRIGYKFHEGQTCRRLKERKGGAR